MYFLELTLLSVLGLCARWRRLRQLLGRQFCSHPTGV